MEEALIGLSNRLEMGYKKKGKFLIGCGISEIMKTRENSVVAAYRRFLFRKS